MELLNDGQGGSAYGNATSKPKAAAQSPFGGKTRISIQVSQLQKLVKLTDCKVLPRGPGGAGMTTRSSDLLPAFSASYRHRFRCFRTPRLPCFKQGVSSVAHRVGVKEGNRTGVSGAHHGMRLTHWQFAERGETVAGSLRLTLTWL